MTAAEICVDRHGPQVVSVGLPFLVVELASRDALLRACPDRQGYGAVLPLDGARAVYAYTRDAADAGCDLHARMFTSRMVEDPATGSATAAMAGLLAELGGATETELRVNQGFDMGRPSRLLTRVRRDGDKRWPTSGDGVPPCSRARSSWQAKARERPASRAGDPG